MFTINTLVVKEIKRSIDLMDEFEDGDYDFLEMQHWFWVKDSKERDFSFTDNAGRFYISLMVSKVRNRNKALCKYEPTMTELRQMQHHGLTLDEYYEEGTIDSIIRDACKVWRKNEFIELSTEICLRAQTSWNRMDYGCEWLGGGDWEEKTLYGETTDFYITGIILREPYKSVEQEAREILVELQNRYSENEEFIDKVMNTFKKLEQPVIHKKFGRGMIVNIIDGKILVNFENNSGTFKYPDSILQGFFSIPENYEVVIDATEKWNENIILQKKIKKFQYDLKDNNIVELILAVRDFQLEGKK